MSTHEDQSELENEVLLKNGGTYPPKGENDAAPIIRAQAWDEGAEAMRAAWDTDGEIVEPTNPYRLEARE